MNVLGIELKSDNLIGIVVKKIETTKEVTITEQIKITLSDSYSAHSVKVFFEEIKEIINKNNLNIIIIKKRNEKGKFAGGAVSFKMEGLIQLAAKQECHLVSAQQLSKFSEKITDKPVVKKYQEEALACALFGIMEF